MSDKSPLEEKALMILDLDQRVIKCLMEGNTAEFPSALSEYLACRQKLKIELLSEGAITINDQDAANVVRNLFSNRGLPSDEIIKRIEAHSAEDLSTLNFDDNELWEIGSDIFYSWYSHAEYVEALSELRPLILNTSSSSSVQRIVDQIRNCYAFQQYDAAYSLCRTLLEASIRDICVQCGMFPDLGSNVVLFEKFSWGELRRKVSSGALENRLRDLYGDLCEVLHARRSVTETETKKAFQETLSVIEELYNNCGL